MRMGNKSSLTDFLTERVNHTSRKCCFAHRWLISLVAAIGKPEKANHSEDFELPRGLCVIESVWTKYWIVVLFDRQISAGGSQLKQRQEVDAGSDCGKSYYTKRGSIASISCTRRQKSGLSTISLR